MSSATQQQSKTEAQPPPPNYWKFIQPTTPTQIPTHQPKSQTHGWPVTAPKS